jgi:hypothetical protein
MFDAITARPPRDLVKWCTGGLLLLMPGSFVVLPLWWLGRYAVSWAIRPRALPHAQP